jgi:hypothetical protein
LARDREELEQRRREAREESASLRQKAEDLEFRLREANGRAESYMVKL